MLLVKTRIGPSKIAGIGLFADQFISKGTMIWKFTPGLDLEVNRCKLARLSPAAKKQFLNYAYLIPDTSTYVLCFDDARFFNHSECPNVLDVEVPGEENWVVVARGDIAKGDELTCDYRGFDADFNCKMEMH